MRRTTAIRRMAAAYLMVKFPPTSPESSRLPTALPSAAGIRFLSGTAAHSAAPKGEISSIMLPSPTTRPSSAHSTARAASHWLRTACTSCSFTPTLTKSVLFFICTSSLFFFLDLPDVSKTKVFVHLLQKVAGVQRAAPAGRAPQSSKHQYRQAPSRA